MTPEEMAAERNKAFSEFDSVWNRIVNPKHKWVDPDHYEEVRLTQKASFAKGWLAAKQDSEQQRKELQERINHDPKY